MPELRQLRTFVAVAEHLSFTRAAETLGLKQQTVSKSIADLEAELGVALLERTTREVRLTDAGTALLEPARETLRLLDVALSTAQAVGEGRLGTVRIGISPSIGSADTNEIASAIRSNAEEMAVSFREVSLGDLHQALRERRVDIALSRTVGAEAPGLHRAELRPTPAAVFVASKHPLARRGAVSLEEFDGERLLAASAQGTAFTDLLVRRFADAGANVEVLESRVTGGSASMLTELAQTKTIAVKPACTEAPSGVVRLDVEGLTIPLLLLWPAGLPSKTALWLQKALGPSRPENEES